VAPEPPGLPAAQRSPPLNARWLLHLLPLPPLPLSCPQATPPATSPACPCTRTAPATACSTTPPWGETCPAATRSTSAPPTDRRQGLVRLLCLLPCRWGSGGGVRLSCGRCGCCAPPGASTRAAPHTACTTAILPVLLAPPHPPTHLQPRRPQDVYSEISSLVRKRVAVDAQAGMAEARALIEDTTGGAGWGAGDGSARGLPGWHRGAA
jgi:hypothetical protein